MGSTASALAEWAVEPFSRLASRFSAIDPPERAEPRPMRPGFSRFPVVQSRIGGIVEDLGLGIPRGSRVVVHAAMRNRGRNRGRRRDGGSGALVRDLDHPVREPPLARQPQVEPHIGREDRRATADHRRADEQLDHVDDAEPQGVGGERRAFDG